MRAFSYLPNLLSSLRIALAPGILGAAYSNSQFGFAVLLGVALVTDALDGFLARCWAAETAIGRRLDRWGDGLTMTLAAVGVSFLWPQVVADEWVWVMVALAGYLMIGVQRLVGAPVAAAQPSWLAKGLGALVPLSLVPLLMGWAAWPFHAAAVLQFAVGLEKLLTVRTGSGRGSGQAGRAWWRRSDWLLVPKRRCAKG